MQRNAIHSWLNLVALIIAGEAVFSLPFHVARFFRPTFLQATGMSNTELGVAQAGYGVVAMACYFLGGPLADRYPARNLIVYSLLSTAAGGLYFATLPGLFGMRLLWGFWGCTTIMLFWAALIRATREWGGATRQGAAFGLLDSGRGLFSAAMATLSVALFAMLLPADTDMIDSAQRQQALRCVILGYSAVTVLAALLVALCVPAATVAKLPGRRAGGGSGLLIYRVARMPTVWLQSLVIVCAYSAYKGVDNYSLYAVQVHGMNEVSAAALVAAAGWVRPIAAVVAGIAADRFGTSRVISLCFIVLLLGYLFFSLAPVQGAYLWLLVANVFLTCAALFAARGIYFALLEDAQIPIHCTGTAVGLVSFIGFTPDIFVAPIAGWLLDRSPGIAGHQYFFWFLAGMACCGLIANLLLRRHTSV